MISGPSAGFWKGGWGGGGPCRGLWIIDPSGGSRISGYRGCIEKVSQKVWGILCEKSRFYAKKSYLTNFRKDAGCAPLSLDN